LHPGELIPEPLAGRSRKSPDVGQRGAEPDGGLRGHAGIYN
jgi:hypothetical protein